MPSNEPRFDRPPVRLAAVLRKRAWRITACCAIALALTSCGGCEGKPSNPWKSHTRGLPFVMDYAAGMEQAVLQRKPVLLFFTATWCGPCKQFSGDSFTHPDVQELMGQFVCVLVDGDADLDAMNRHGVRSYPTIILLSPASQELDRFSGYRSRDEFQGMLAKALAESAD
ncbi:MAG: thioredoxin family protein [Planctomycetales bacterium]